MLNVIQPLVIGNEEIIIGNHCNSDTVEMSLPC